MPPSDLEMINFRRLSVVLNIGLVLIALMLTIDVWDRNKKDAYWAFLLVVAVLSAINFAWVSRKKKPEEPQPDLWISASKVKIEDKVKKLK